MTAKTLKALKASIAHWERMRNKKPEFGNEEPRVSGCALCGLFFNNDCTGCPVMGKTGISQCRDTPFDKASRIWIKLASGGTFDLKAWRASATAEIKFLRSLLPRKKKV